MMGFGGMGSWRDMREGEMNATRYFFDNAGCPDENEHGDYVEYDDYALISVQLRDETRIITAYQIAKDNSTLRLQAKYSYSDPTEEQERMFSDANASDTAMWQVY